MKSIVSSRGEQHPEHSRVYTSVGSTLPLSLYTIAVESKLGLPADRHLHLLGRAISRDLKRGAHALQAWRIAYNKVSAGS